MGLGERLFSGRLEFVVPSGDSIPNEQLTREWDRRRRSTASPGSNLDVERSRATRWDNGEEFAFHGRKGDLSEIICAPQECEVVIESVVERCTTYGSVFLQPLEGVGRYGFERYRVLKYFADYELPHSGE